MCWFYSVALEVMRFVSVAGCLGYDVLGTCFFISEILSVFQLLVV